MRMTPAVALFFALVGCGEQPAPTEPSPIPAASEETALNYPDARRDDTVSDDYFGTPVADPYRWLEDPDAPESRTWIEAQNTLTQGWIGAIDARKTWRDRLEKLWNYERFGLPHEKAGRYFFTHNDGLQDQAILYVADSPTGDKTVLLDPNTLSEDGTISLAGYAVSEDGTKLAYGLSDGGSDWRTWRVRDIATGKDTNDVVEWVKFSGASWTHDGAGFFYGRYPDGGDDKLEAHNDNYKVYYHRLGTPQSDDTVAYERPDEPTWDFGSRVTDDGKTLVVTSWRSTAEINLVHIKDLTSPDAEFRAVVPDWTGSFTFLGNVGNKHWYKTDVDAPKSRIVQIDVTNPGKEHWVEVVPQSDHVLETASMVGGKIIGSYLEDAKSVVRLFDQDGSPAGQIKLPGIGSASGFGGKLDSTETFFAFTSYTTPTTLYRYDFATGAAQVHRQPDVDFDPAEFETKQVFYKSKDGTAVPMFITHKKGLEPTGDTPTILYGYGGFNISLSPGFKVENIVWMEAGGIYAVANLRGGNEYGEEWHQGGIKQNKQNVFDDFIAAAEYLIANKYTRPDRLAITGRSNGGLLIGATVQQRPELFGAAIPGVGVMDMLRYHTWTIGHFWASDYGTSADDKAMFEYLHAYSPVHNAKEQEYPHILVTTGDHDDRVVPAHSFKFAAAMQRAQRGPSPVLIRIETRAGHGAGTPIKMLIDQRADEAAFLVRALNFTPKL